MKRKDAINWMRIAGYHDDNAAFTRLYIENKVSFVVAKQAFNEGRAQRDSGVRCSCHDCKEPSP